MDHEIEPAPVLLQAGEQPVEAFLVLDIGLLDDLRAELLDHRQHALAEGRALVGEGQLGAGGVQGLGDAPGDRTLVGHAHDQAALAGHQLGHLGQGDGLGRRGGRRVVPTAAGGIGGGGEGTIVGHGPPQWS